LELLPEETGKNGAVVSRGDPLRKRVWLSEAAGGPKARRRKGNPSPGRQRLEEWLLTTRAIESGIVVGLAPQVAVAKDNSAGGEIGQRAAISGTGGADVGPEDGWASAAYESASKAHTPQGPLEVALVAEYGSEREGELMAPRVVECDLAGHGDAGQGFERVNMGAEVVLVEGNEVAAANPLWVGERAVSTAKRKQMGIGDWCARKTVGPKKKLVRVETELAGELGVRRRWVEDDAEMPGKRMRESGRWEPAADAEPPD